MLKIVQDNKNLMWFTLLSYIDKGLAFILPLLVLYLFNDKDAYNELEYAYSIANIGVYLFSVGSMYSFYGYREAEEKTQYIKSYLSISSISILLTAIISIALLCMRPEIGKEISFIVYVLIAARLMLLLFVNFFSAYYRLIDQPSRILIYTIAISCIIVLSLGISYIHSIDLLYSFALPELFVPIIVCLYFILNQKVVSFHCIFNYYKKSIIFAWPLLLNCFLGLGISNFGKIYAFNYMTSDDMYVFSYTMRISMVIGMAHTSILAFYSKNIYTNKFTKGIALKYILFLTTSAFLSFLLIIALNGFLPQKLPIDTTMLIIFIYNVVFYAGSFCEAFYGRENRNEMILLFSALSASVFIVLILLTDNMTLLSISTIMLVYAIIRLIMMFFGVWRIRLSRYLIKD